MSEWISVEDRLPENNDLVLVWRRWPGNEEFGPDFDAWEIVDACGNVGDWVISEDQCQSVECMADGPGVVARPETTHWMQIPADPTK